MVRILSNGDIVQDDDPRVQRRREPSERFGTIDAQSDSYRSGSGYAGNYHGGGGDAIPYHGGQPQYAEGPTFFDTWNQKLLQMGIPRWNIGSHTVEPLMTVMFLVLMLVFGLPGLLFLGVLYAIVRVSNRNNAPARHRVARRPEIPRPSGRRLGD